MGEEVEHRRNSPEQSSVEDHREALTREEYQRNQVHLNEVLQLRRAQDLKLLEMLEKTYNDLGDRFTSVETAVREMHGQSEARQVMFEEFKARQRRHEERIGELDEGTVRERRGDDGGPGKR